VTTLKAYYVACDATGCSEKAHVSERDLTDGVIPLKWARTRTFDRDEPWEFREYDACSVTCLVSVQAEAAELRYQFDIGGEEPVDNYEHEEAYE